MEWSLAIIALRLLAVAAVSRRSPERPSHRRCCSSRSASWSGREVLDGIDLAPSSSLVRTAAEATLALVLFADASRIDLRELRRSVVVPARLLGFGLPLTIALGALAAQRALRPADLRRGHDPRRHPRADRRRARPGRRQRPRVPARISQALNVESGLNDGICVPLLFAAVALADAESEISGGRSPVDLLLEEIGYGVLGGVAAGALVACHHPGRRPRGLITPHWRQVVPVAGAGSPTASRADCTDRASSRPSWQGWSSACSSVATRPRSTS